MSKIASTYAKALYDIALEENVLEEVKNDFNVIVSSIKEQPQFLNVLTLPKLDKEEKKQLIKSIFSSNTPQI
ncbi:F0F1 ATP synthase subunit delta, partial [Turicibacter sanguinis]|nr:F0F1 ATP synthase subunit delta [Turicibacter sanguinis]